VIRSLNHHEEERKKRRAIAEIASIVFSAGSFLRPVPSWLPIPPKLPVLRQNKRLSPT
jgi:hypothetical protein